MGQIRFIRCNGNDHVLLLENTMYSKNNRPKWLNQ